MRILYGVLSVLLVTSVFAQQPPFSGYRGGALKPATNLLTDPIVSTGTLVSSQNGSLQSFLANDAGMYFYESIPPDPRRRVLRAIPVLPG